MEVPHYKNEQAWRGTVAISLHKVSDQTYAIGEIAFAIFGLYLLSQWSYWAAVVGTVLGYLICLALGRQAAASRSRMVNAMIDDPDTQMRDH